MLKYIINVMIGLSVSLGLFVCASSEAAENEWHKKTISELKCDRLTSRSIDISEQYRFFLDFNCDVDGKSECGLTKFTVVFSEKNDLDGSKENVRFDWTDYVKQNDFIVGEGSHRVLQAEKYYPIKYRPLRFLEPDEDNSDLIVAYTIEYHFRQKILPLINGSWSKNARKITHCIAYKIK